MSPDTTSGKKMLPYYSAALDEVYRLRAALAYEAKVREADLSLASFPRSRRRHAADSIDRMRAAAQGLSHDAYHRQDWFDAKAALTSAGADDCLTRGTWEQQRPQVRHDDGVTVSCDRPPHEYDQTRQRWSLGIAVHLAPDDKRLATLFRNAPLLLWSDEEWARDDAVRGWCDLEDEVEDHYYTAALEQLTDHGHPDFPRASGVARGLIDNYRTANRLLGYVMLAQAKVNDVLTAVLAWQLSRHVTSEVEIRVREGARKLALRKEFREGGYTWTGHSKSRNHLHL